MQVVKFDIFAGVKTAPLTVAEFIEDDSLPAVDLRRALKVSSPCSQSWFAMHGDNKKRFCHSCNLFVYNIEEMTRAEVVQVLRENESKRICKRVRKRRDGTIIMRDCPVGVHIKKGKMYLMWSALGYMTHFAAGIVRWVVSSFSEPFLMGA